LVIQIRGQVLFPSGSATLSREAESIMDQIARIVSRYTEYMVNIKGHTDNVPISTAKFDSNWELSALRATSVLKYFIKRGINPLRLTATGYADILPLVPNNSDENRSRNRRVEFVLEKKPEYY
jgi:chemotaxis protein MotB